jgi:hypothetical protein
MLLLSRQWLFTAAVESVASDELFVKEGSRGGSEVVGWELIMSPGELVIRRGMLKQDEIGKTSRTNEFIGTLLLPDEQFSFRGETSSASTRRPNAENSSLIDSCINDIPIMRWITVNC